MTLCKATGQVRGNKPDTTTCSRVIRGDRHVAGARLAPWSCVQSVLVHYLHVVAAGKQLGRCLARGAQENNEDPIKKNQKFRIDCNRMNSVSNMPPQEACKALDEKMHGFQIHNQRRAAGRGQPSTFPCKLGPLLLLLLCLPCAAHAHDTCVSTCTGPLMGLPNVPSGVTASMPWALGVNATAFDSFAASEGIMNKSTNQDAWPFGVKGPACSAWSVGMCKVSSHSTFQQVPKEPWLLCHALLCVLCLNFSLWLCLCL